MLVLEIPNNGNFILNFDEANVHRFAPCTFIYEKDSLQVKICEDDLYFIIESIFNRIQNIPELKSEKMLGKLGKWQEYHYYNSIYVKKNMDAIEQMEKAIFLSAEHFGSFMYKCKGSIWLELNRGFQLEKDKKCKAYYSNPMNYRLFLSEIPRSILAEWQNGLQKIKVKTD